MNTAEKNHLFCENCRKHLILECHWNDVRETAKQHGWIGSREDGSLCDSCSKTCYMSSFPDGEYNHNFCICANSEGIEVGDYTSISWEWIFEMIAKLGIQNKEANE